MKTHTPSVSSWWYAYACRNLACPAPGTMLDLSLPAPERDAGPPIACPICAAPMKFSASWPADASDYGSRSGTGWTNRVPTPEEAAAEVEYGGRWAWRADEESPWRLLDTGLKGSLPPAGQFRLYDRDGHPTMWRGSPEVDASYPHRRYVVVVGPPPGARWLYRNDTGSTRLDTAVDHAIDVAGARSGDEIEIIVHRTGRRREEL